MSVKREDNICTITFEDENWKEEAPEVFTVTDGAVPFYTADTWKYNEKNTYHFIIVLYSVTITNSGYIDARYKD